MFKSLPSLSNSHALVDTLCSSSLYVQIADPNFHHILICPLQHSCTEEDLVTDVISVNPKNYVLPNSEAESSYVYFWSILDNFEDFCMQAFKKKKNAYIVVYKLTHVINCKQETQELGSLSVASFHKAWTQHAG